VRSAAGGPGSVPVRGAAGCAWGGQGLREESEEVGGSVEGLGGGEEGGRERAASWRMGRLRWPAQARTRGTKGEGESQGVWEPLTGCGAGCQACWAG